MTFHYIEYHGWISHTHTHTQCWVKEYRYKSTYCLILFIWSCKTGKTITLSVKLYREISFRRLVLGAEINYKGQEEIWEMIEDLFSWSLHRSTHLLKLIKLLKLCILSYVKLFLKSKKSKGHIYLALLMESGPPKMSEYLTTAGDFFSVLSSPFQKIQGRFLPGRQSGARRRKPFLVIKLYIISFPITSSIR